MEVCIEGTSSTLDRAWDAFFVSLALAEAAAAEQCRIIENEFRGLGEDALAEEYNRLSLEETSHFRLATSVCKSFQPISPRAAAAYRGEFFSKEPLLIERLAAVHLVFEPAALAFLGHIRKNARKLVSDPKWAKEIERAFSAILRDEVNHVYTGIAVLQDSWKDATPEQKATTRVSVRKCRAFLKAGLPSFFREIDDGTDFVTKMLRRFDFYYSKHARVLNG